MSTACTICIDEQPIQTVDEGITNAAHANVHNRFSSPLLSSHTNNLLRSFPPLFFEKRSQCILPRLSFSFCDFFYFLVDGLTVHFWKWFPQMFVSFFFISLTSLSFSLFSLIIFSLLRELLEKMVTVFDIVCFYFLFIHSFYFRRSHSHGCNCYGLCWNWSAMWLGL